MTVVNSNLEIEKIKKRRRLVGVVTPHSAGTLAFGTCHAEGIVLDKYFFGDRSESVASRFGVPSKYAW
jgi:hypothetical protein